MTDLNKLRSEFEGIPEIKTHLDHGNVFWSDKNQTYASEFQCLHAVACYVNGAWFGWLEKAKAKVVPEGYVLMPKVPSEKMFQAYERYSVAPMSTLSKTGYKAMVEASESGAEQ
ncbi:hypothetical protein JL975_12930 [Acinetobacter baumannii]|uniref:hypothetical protein n=1 Tax=Acinetobacter baumannii TaxID=470 RepID=UPI001C443F2D|nr:hypothetical protein [Acinetobacter baumannii]MBV6584036.1 hypothetical protein [Acinetobacter baumannii]MBV6608573.1 hypothetical protein [Acinetobacter baumannii]MBV6612070.1 hypothetical protein [Acinetobacter baumannii]